MKHFSFLSLIALFFLWGLLTSLNDILVPHLKGAFDLKHWQAQLIQFFFFGAYFVMSLPAGWVIKKLGYQRGIVLGLLLMGLGCAIFYPASIVKMYGVFLLALFVLATGIILLQVAANPYVAVLGPSPTAASRLNLAQGFNSLGHTLAPLFGAWLILQNTENIQVESVQGPYLALAMTLWIIGLIFWFLPLPGVQYETTTRQGFRWLDHPQLMLGMVAIFCYVGAEVSIGSFLAEYFKSEPSIGFDNKTAGSHIAFYWGGAMVGRFLGAISLGKFRPFHEKLVKLLPIPVLAILVVSGVAFFQKLDASIILGFGTLLLINYLAFLFGKSLPHSMLALFASICGGLILITMLGKGQVALWAVLGIGLFNSIMWSNIFTLSIDGLGKYTSLGSALLVAMIVGGALIPLLQGLAADWIGIKASFMVPLVSYVYLIFYGLKGFQRANAG